MHAVCRRSRNPYSQSRRESPQCSKKFAGTPVTATEPVFGYMLDALGMQVRNMRFQIAVMNDSEPGALEVAGFENDLKTRSRSDARLQ